MSKSVFNLQDILFWQILSKTYYVLGIALGTSLAWKQSGMHRRKEQIYLKRVWNNPTWEEVCLIGQNKDIKF